MVVVVVTTMMMMMMMMMMSVLWCGIQDVVRCHLNLLHAELSRLPLLLDILLGSCA